LPVLVCNSTNNDHAWVNVAAVTTPDQGELQLIDSWTVTFGVEDMSFLGAVEIINSVARINSSHADVAKLSAEITVSGTVSPEEIADLILYIMYEIQHINAPSLVDIILESR